MPAFSQGTETSSRGKTVHQASSENWNGQGGWQANRPPVQKGPEAGMSLPASARQPGRSRSQPFCFGFWHFWSGAFCRNMHIVGLLPKEVTDSLTQQLEERGGWGTILSFTNFFLKQGLIPRPFFVVLWPLIFTKNHCVYMKWQFDTAFDIKLFFCYRGLHYSTLFIVPLNDLGDSLVEIDGTLRSPPGHRWMKTQRSIKSGSISTHKSS